MSYAEYLEYGKEWSLHGGYPTFDQANDLLNMLLYQYPDRLRRESIGKSFQGRDIFVYRLFQESTQPKLNLPKVLLMSGMHGNEPVPVLVTLYAMHYFLRWSEEVLPIREIYILPFLNPDAFATGSVVGEFKYRKNLRPTCDSDSAKSGVDLNRNFDFNWSNSSLPDPCGIEFAGSGPSSEPETQALVAFMARENFVSSMNVHSFGDILIYPYNSDASRSVPPKHQAFYEQLGADFRMVLTGPAPKVLKYTTTGEATDFMYHNLSTIALSIEVGPENGGFIPPIQIAFETARDNLPRIKSWIFRSGIDINDIRFEPAALAKDARISLHNGGLSKKGSKVRLLVQSPSSCSTCSAGGCDQLGERTQIYTFSPELIPLDWSEPLDVRTCTSSSRKNLLICVLEDETGCTCFPRYSGRGWAYDVRSLPISCMKERNWVSISDAGMGSIASMLDGFSGILFLLSCLIIVMLVLRKIWTRRW